MEKGKTKTERLNGINVRAAEIIIETMVTVRQNVKLDQDCVDMLVKLASALPGLHTSAEPMDFRDALSKVAMAGCSAPAGSGGGQQ